MKRPSIWWIRRDIRVHDNPAVTSALQRGSSLIPLFILNPRLMESNRVAPDHSDWPVTPYHID